MMTLMKIRYVKKRMWRVGIVYAASQMASRMLESYQPYIKFRTGPLAVSFPQLITCFNLLKGFPNFHLTKYKVI